MGSCDMCGKETELYECVIEGSTLKTCSRCSSFGKVLKKPPKKHKKVFKKPEKKEKVLRIIKNYSQVIRTAREKKELTQKDFAKILSERESIIHKMESGQFRPSIKTARKLERILKIRLIEELDDDSPVQSKRRRNEGLTIGDLIKF
ncbi:multiprotein bridging factor aMBF1 [Nanoarchaeota archaeon]